MLNQRLRVVLATLLTGLIIHFVPNRLLVTAILAVLWALLFFPLRWNELIVFALAGVFFVGQNYVCLKAGLFEFRFKDVLLMPYYEPLLWGFYFLSMKRFLSTADTTYVFNWKSVAGLAVTSIAFSVFSFDSRALFAATLCSTALLFVLFHTTRDVQHALFALALGLVVELFGVSTGLWSYPAPDFLGIPFWFATMWLSVGLLGYRFLFPAANWVAASK
jgi:hypothetical protein